MELYSGSTDLSKAVSVERAYGVQMNVKEAAIESLRQGALAGFNDYDSSHELSACQHCPDAFCLPPPATNFCDAARCAKCFREPEARRQAEDWAVSRMSALRSHVFDSDFSVSLGQPQIESFTRAEPLAKNGFALDRVRFRSDLGIDVTSQKLQISAHGKLPEGMVIYHG